MFVKIYILLLCATLSFKNVAASTAICSGKTISEQGSNSFPDPADCSKYVMCTNYETDGFIVTGYSMNCSFPLYWNDEKKTCDHVSNVECQNDYCADKADGVVREGHGNCRGYWICSGGKSKHVCCLSGQMFNASVVCQDVPADFNCTHSCDSDLNVTVTPSVCNKTAIPNDRSSYTQFVEGHGDLKFPCSIGTFFNETSCHCDHDTLSTAQKTCKPDLYIPFNNDTDDQSDVHIKVTNHGVTVFNGSGDFDGSTSELIISRYNNIGQYSTFIINMVYTSTHGNLNAAHTLVANDHCGNTQPSVIIKEDSTTVYFTVGLDGGSFESVQIPQPATNRKSIVFELNNGQFTGSVNGDSASVNATGFLQNAQCALTFGSSKDNDFFNGSVDEIIIYLCEPSS